MRFIEEWKQIRGFPGYEVSNYGRIRSLARNYKYGSHGIIVLKTNDRHGYRGVTLFRDGKRHYKAVHRLVAEAFISNPDDLPIINHKDEDRTNNRVDNLEWSTYKYNSNYGDCRRKISDRVSRKVGQYTKNGELIAIHKSMTIASRETGACLSEISKCCKDFRHSAGGYKWRKVI